MGDTLNRAIPTGPSVAGNTVRMGLNGHHQSDTTSINNMGIGYTPSIMSPIKYGTGIGLTLGGGETTLYSLASPPTRL